MQAVSIYSISRRLILKIMCFSLNWNMEIGLHLHKTCITTLELKARHGVALTDSWLIWIGLCFCFTITYISQFEIWWEKKRLNILNNLAGIQLQYLCFITKGFICINLTYWQHKLINARLDVFSIRRLWIGFHPNSLFLFYILWFQSLFTQAVKGKPVI